MKQYKVTYKGKSYESKDGFNVISVPQYEAIKSEWYSKPDYKTVQIEMAGLREGLTDISNITKYYFRSLMDNTVKYFDKWSVNDVLESIELTSVFVDKVGKNKTVFSDNSLVKNLDTAFRLGGKGIASKVAQFPVKTVDDILYEYNANGNWYDYSCGWGGRLAGAMKNKVNYFGTDPNYLLVEQLRNFARDYKTVGGINTVTDIRCQGSETFVPEWENTMGLAFSSPPYFLLEDYKIGEQSYLTGRTTYKEWIDNYLQPTINNIYKYLINDGYFVCNIKDFDKYTLENDTIKCAEIAGFELYKIDSLNGAIRVAGVQNSETVNMVDASENIYVFCKRGVTPRMCHDEQISLF